MWPFPLLPLVIWVDFWATYSWMALCELLYFPCSFGVLLLSSYCQIYPHYALLYPRRCSAVDCCKIEAHTERISSAEALICTSRDRSLFIIDRKYFTTDLQITY